MQTPFDRELARNLDQDVDNQPEETETRYPDRDRDTHDTAHHAGGALDNLGGKIEEAAGGVTGNERLQEEGRAKQMRGDEEQGYGTARDRVDEHE